MILSSVQLISMILTATLTDQIGRRPLTVYPYAVTVMSLLSLGIIGCFDYTGKATSSLLVGLRLDMPRVGGTRLTHIHLGVLRLLGDVLDYRCLGHRLCLCSGDSPAASPCADRWLVSGRIQRHRHHVQLLYSPHDQWFHQMGRQDRLLVSAQTSETPLSRYSETHMAYFQLRRHGHDRGGHCVVHPARGGTKDTS